MIPKANKCYTVPLCLGIFVCFILVSCTDAKTSTFDNTLPVDKVEVLINYGGFETNKATTYLANELDISQRTLFSKEDNAKIVSSLIGEI